MTDSNLVTDKDWLAEDTLQRAGVVVHPAVRRRLGRRRQAEVVARREERRRRTTEESARRKADKERRPPVPTFWPELPEAAPSRPSTIDRRRVRWALPIAACFAAGVAILVAGANYWFENTGPVEAFPPSAAGDLIAEAPPAGGVAPIESLASDESESLDTPGAVVTILPDTRTRDDTEQFIQALETAKTPTDPTAGDPAAADSAPDESSPEQTARVTARPQLRPAAAQSGAATGRLSGRELQALVPGAVTRGTNALGHEFVYRFKADGTVAASTFVSANARSSDSLIETSVPWRIVGDTLCVSFAGAQEAPRTCHQVHKMGGWYEAHFADGTPSAKFTLEEQ